MSDTDRDGVYDCFPPDMSDADSSGSSTPNHQYSPSFYHFFPPYRSDTDSYGSSTPKQFSISSFSILLIFPPAMDSPNNCEIIFRTPSIPSYYHCFPPDRSDTDSYGSSIPMQFFIPSLHCPPNKSQTINSKLVIYRISLDEWILQGIKMDRSIEVVDILRGKRLTDLMVLCVDELDKKEDKRWHFNRILSKFSQAVARGGRSPENLLSTVDKYDEVTEAMEELDKVDVISIMFGWLRNVDSKIVKPRIRKRPNYRASITESDVYTTLREYTEKGTLKKLTERGDIHPLTQKMMKLIVDHICDDDDHFDHYRNRLKMNPVASQLLLVVVHILESRLEKKSKLYADGALRCIFLMNNILYMKQKVKDLDLGGLLGDNWVRRRQGQIRQYAMGYLRASWTKVLDCLNDRGTPWSWSNIASVFFPKKKASAVALQERLKNFNACFEEIYNVQTAWIVPDAQLRKELRISILESVIPAYRLFMGRYGNQVESGRHVEKYYTADNLENYLFDLFKGSRRTLVSFNPAPRVY